MEKGKGKGRAGGWRKNEAEGAKRVERRDVEEIKVDHQAAGSRIARNEGTEERVGQREEKGARETENRWKRRGMRHKGAMEKEKIGEGMRVLNGWGEEERGASI